MGFVVSAATQSCKNAVTRKLNTQRFGANRALSTKGLLLATASVSLKVSLEVEGGSFSSVPL